MRTLRFHSGIRVTLTAVMLAALAATLSGDGSLLRGQLSAGTLPACEADADLFPPFSDDGSAEHVVMQWKQLFDGTVNEVTEAHLASAENRITCTEYPVVEASDELWALALQLEPWKSGAALTEADFAAVVLQYLRAYECTLNGRGAMLMTEVAQDAETDDTLGDLPVYEQGNEDQQLFTLAMETGEEEIDTDQELAMATRSVHRLLRYVSGLDRLRPVEAALRCLERASLDIRNVLALNADAAACMYSVKGQGSLRDLAP